MVFVLAWPASALPVSLQVDPSASSLNISITVIDEMFGGTASQAVSLHGDVTAALSLTVDPLFGEIPSALQVLSADLSLDGIDYDIPVQFFGFLHATSPSLGANLASPATSGILPGANQNVFDLGGGAMTIDSGLLSFDPFGPITGFGDLSVDFAQQSSTFTMPPGSTVKVIEDRVAPQRTNLTLMVPISVTGTLRTSPIPITAQLSGLLVATGMKLVPEPGSFLLLAIGALLVQGLWLRMLHRNRR